MHRQGKNWLNKQDFDSEILIADNGSTDNSIAIAHASGARVVRVEKRGYGNALRSGCEHAHGRYIIMGDADGSYDFERLDSFYEACKQGSDFVIGNRFQGGIEPGAMPLKNKFLGNPLLSFLGRLLFRTNIKDFHCGLRAISKTLPLTLWIFEPREWSLLLKWW